MPDESCEHANKLCWTMLHNSNPFTQLGHESRIHAHERLTFPFKDVPLHTPPP
jgi:hypothetical protein